MQGARTLKPPTDNKYNDMQQLELLAMYYSMPIIESTNTRDSIFNSKETVEEKDMQRPFK